LDRPTKIIRAFNTSAQNQATFAYDDTARTITTTSDLNSNFDGALVSKTLYDGLGRTTETRQYEGGTNYIATQQQYDALGRASKTSNPFRPWQSESPVWTTTGFDALGRVISVTTPDNAVVSTSYGGNTVTVTDQAGKARKSVTDGLGRLKEVYEDPNGLNYLTSYAYDVLDDLTTVTQGVQTRTFVYDSLKRLSSASNPESGTITYGYDNNGNLTSKLDARSITTTFIYDALNRVTSKSYNDNPQTPTVSYFYDSQTLPSGAPSFDRGYATGRLVAVTYGSGSSAGTYRGYDQMGRVVRQYQRTDSVNYLVEATYWANSALKDETYPSVPGAGDRRVVSHVNDSAGRLASLSSAATTYAPGASVSSIGYASHNALKTETYGNSLVHAMTYNNRLQPNEIKLGTSGAPTSIVDLVYNYGTTNNNGNVQSVTYAGGGLGYTQTFGYDQLNRLTTSQENSGANWSQTNGYDRYGNRWVDLGGGNQSLYFNVANNRISGWSYDAGGNLLNDGAHAYTYDAENKISKVDAVSAYVYDGEGQRVRKLVGENLRFIYDMGGKQIAEFDGAAGTLKKEYIYGESGLVATIEPTAINSNSTRYTTSDHLGSPRVITNSSAGVVSRHDYKPFGEELGSGIGGRTAAMGFGVADSLRQKFTSKERDNETGLDYFLARYYSSTQGRFTSPDEFTGGPDELYYFVDDASDNPTFYADLRNPQSLNKYQYAFNNPLRYVDPDGHDAEEVDPDPDPPQGQTRSIPIPRGPGPTPAEAQQTIEAIKALDRWIDKQLLPIKEIIGTATPQTIDPIVIAPTTTTTPQSQAQPLAPPAPIQFHPKKKQSTGKNKDHKKETERPGRKQPPNYRPFRRPPPKPKPTPKPPKPKPKPKPEIDADGNPVNPGS
jgi:RHS repeat-associated protein